MFNGTLSTWNTKPLDLELNYDTKSVCLCPYPVLKVHKEFFIKQVNKLVYLGVLEHTNGS